MATSCASTGPGAVDARVADSDGDPMRVRLLGEDLIAFRDSNGQIGVLGNHCPHRGASLFSGATSKPACAASTTAGNSTRQVGASTCPAHHFRGG